MNNPRFLSTSKKLIPANGEWKNGLTLRCTRCSESNMNNETHLFNSNAMAMRCALTHNTQHTHCDRIRCSHCMDVRNCGRFNWRCAVWVYYYTCAFVRDRLAGGRECRGAGGSRCCSHRQMAADEDWMTAYVCMCGMLRACCAVMSVMLRVSVCISLVGAMLMCLCESFELIRCSLCTVSVLHPWSGNCPLLHGMNPIYNCSL